jgi:catechol 2,3-dioxygenase-like lactoylglutathione lyase family enzyme
MDQHITAVTLGVADLPRSEAFYRALGWERVNDDAEVAFFQAGGMVLALWGRAALAEDGGVEDPGGWGGVTLSQNVRSPQEVDAIVAAAREAGATVGHEPGETFWGGYAAVFADPDGHTWEIAHNPFWPMDEQGGVRVPRSNS